MKDKIKKIRGDLTYEQFGTELSKSGYAFTKGNLWRYEHDDNLKPSYNFYYAVALVFDVNLNWLIADQGQTMYIKSVGKRGK